MQWLLVVSQYKFPSLDGNTSLQGCQVRWCLLTIYHLLSNSLHGVMGVYVSAHTVG